MQTIICLLCACIVHGLPCEKVGGSIDFCVITAQRFQNISIWVCFTFPIFFTRGLGCGFFEQLYFWTVLLYLGMPLVNDACHCYQINPSSHFFHAAKTFRASYSALSPRSHPLTRLSDSFSNAVPSIWCSPCEGSLLLGIVSWIFQLMALFSPCSFDFKMAIGTGITHLPRNLF